MPSNRTVNAVDFAKTVLIWMAQDPDRVATLLAQTGVAVEDLRNLADEPEFLGGVLDVLLHDEAALIAFCDETHHAYEAPAHARATLPGGEVPHWT